MIDACWVISQDKTSKTREKMAKKKPDREIYNDIEKYMITLRRQGPKVMMCYFDPKKSKFYDASFRAAFVDPEGEVHEYHVGNIRKEYNRRIQPLSNIIKERGIIAASGYISTTSGKDLNYFFIFEHSMAWDPESLDKQPDGKILENRSLDDWITVVQSLAQDQAILEYVKLGDGFIVDMVHKRSHHLKVFGEDTAISLDAVLRRFDAYKTVDNTPQVTWYKLVNAAI